MTQKLCKTISSALKAENDSLFSGVWLRWSALSTAERLVCAIIVLMPFWWALGLIPYMIECVAAGIFLYKWWCYGEVRLKKRPSFAVFALFAFYTYQFLAALLLFLNVHPLAELSVDALRNPIGPIDLFEYLLSAFSLPYLVWHIQSNDIRVRLEVVAWACSVSVAQMLAVWLVVHFVFSNAPYNPPRTLWGMLTGKPSNYYRGIGGNSNYLTLYWPTDKAFGGLPRHYSFFHHAETFAQFVGVVGILALDIKNRLWSLLLLLACVFLIGVSGTRSIWIAFPVVAFIRFYFSTSKIGGRWFLFALTAMMSFLILSTPPITNLVFNTYTDTATSISDFRANSTTSRAAIYTGSLEATIDNPLNFIFGHVTPGETVYTITAGAGPRLGTHSFIMGSLLYQGGLVGTGLFMAFWVSLAMWLYRTRVGRSACSLLILLLFSLAFITMVYGYIAPMAIPLSMMLRRSRLKSFNRNVS